MLEPRRVFLSSSAQTLADPLLSALYWRYPKHNHICRLQKAVARKLAWAQMLKDHPSDRPD